MIWKLYDIIIYAIQEHPHNLATLIKDETFIEVLQYYLLDSEYEYEMWHTYYSVIDLCEWCEHLEDGGSPTQHFIWLLGNNLFAQSIKKRECSDYGVYLLKALGDLIRKEKNSATLAQLTEGSSGSMLDQCLLEIMSEDRYEADESTQNQALSMLCEVASGLLQIQGTWGAQLAGKSKDAVFDFVLNNCLMNKGYVDGSTKTYPICKHEDTRMKAY